MKSLKILIICISLSLQYIYAQSNESVWDFPVKPGTEEWKQLKNHAQKVKVCQIPDSLLVTLSTTDLINICLNYPLLMDIMAFNFVQDGIDALKLNFNGINELLNRDESAKLLIEQYSKIYPAKFNKNWPLEEKGEYSFKIMAIELFLAQEEIIKKLNNSEKKYLVRLLLDKQKEKSDPEVYGLISHMTIGLAISRIIISEDNSIIETIRNSNPKIESFAIKGGLHNTELLTDISIMASEFIK